MKEEVNMMLTKQIDFKKKIIDNNKTEDLKHRERLNFLALDFRKEQQDELKKAEDIKNKYKRELDIQLTQKILNQEKVEDPYKNRKSFIKKYDLEIENDNLQDK